MRGVHVATLHRLRRLKRRTIRVSFRQNIRRLALSRLRSRDPSIPHIRIIDIILLHSRRLRWRSQTLPPHISVSSVGVAPAMTGDALLPEAADEAGGAALGHGAAGGHGAVSGVGASAAGPGVGEGEGLEFVGVFFGDFAAVFQGRFRGGFPRGGGCALCANFHLL